MFQFLTTKIGQFYEMLSCDIISVVRHPIPTFLCRSCVMKIEQ